ncbi:MAG: NAD(P)-dependent alcohol dehydrogenase [Planctomycetes bacterium]|nr:NAD(P)-dependent alcohol dehydrogenase [Planctomycetota bacterium]
MRAYRFDRFGLEHLRQETLEPPVPGPGEVLLDVQAISLNFRDLLVIKGLYNPRLELPAIPLSDGAGDIVAIGDGVDRVRVGDRVMSHFVSGWIDGPFHTRYAGTTLGLPRAGLAAEQVTLPAEAVVPLPVGYDFTQAATLPIAALTAWSALVTKGSVQPGQTVLTLGTGGVSIFALQLAKALGATVIITSSSAEKLARARELGADYTINYRQTPEWDKAVLEITGNAGVDVTVETVGAATLNRSLAAMRGGGTVALLGALAGLEGKINVGLILMKELLVAGILTGSRVAFEALREFVGEHSLRPVIDRRFPFDGLPAALRYMESGRHFGKIVVERQ